MMTDLQKYCCEYDGPSVETVGEGKLYAGKFRDDWYRCAIYAIFQCKRDFPQLVATLDFVLECTLPILLAITRYPYISATLGM